MDNDTVGLLKEINSGCKSAVNGISQTLPYVKDDKLKSTMANEKRLHEQIGNRCHDLLNSLGADEKDPHAAAKAFAWIGTEAKLAINSSSSEIACIMADGCNMGIKSLAKYLNQYKAADDESRRLAASLINTEEKFYKDMLVYL